MEQASLFAEIVRVVLCDRNCTARHAVEWDEPVPATCTHPIPLHTSVSPITSMITTDPINRADGIVYLDKALEAGPATHVLVVAVGAYQSTVLESLTSPPISARAIADWFVGPNAQFKNPQRPLGSVAVAISEIDVASSQYLGGEVPRAALGPVRQAMLAWGARADSNPDNLAVLYLAGHGQSMGQKTAFLFEDYGTVRLDAAAGMTEVEQLFGVLETGLRAQKLLFVDCCRTASDLRINQDQMGTALLSPAMIDGPGLQWALCSTSMMASAIGRKGRTTLFADALLVALGGVGSDGSEPQWPIRPSQILDSVTKILKLHAREDEAPQTPTGRTAGSFDIAFPARKQTSTFISLKEKGDWVDSQIVVATPAGQTLASHTGADGEPTFYCGVFEPQRVHVHAEKEGSVIGRQVVDLFGPAQFVELDEATIPSVAIAPAVGKSAFADLVVSLDSKIKTSGFVLAVGRSATPDEASVVERYVVGTEAPLTLNLAPGAYQLEIAAPGGQVVTNNLQAEAGKTIKLIVQPSIDDPRDLLPSRGVLEPEPRSRDFSLPSRTIRSLPGEVAADRVVSLSFDDLEQLLLRSIVRPPSRSLPPVVTAIQGSIEQFTSNPNASASTDLGWGLFNFRDRREIGFIPSVNLPAHVWQPRLLFDKATNEGFALRSDVISQRWEGLLKFLAGRDFERGQWVAKEFADGVLKAMQDKRSNPLAAAAAALIAVGARRDDIFPKDWLDNLSNWFEQMPDGPIVLARYHLIHPEPDLELVRTLFLEALGRGVPFFSLSADWLLRGLEMLDNRELDETTNRVRRMVRRTDPRQAFTVIKVS